MKINIIYLNKNKNKNKKSYLRFFISLFAIFGFSLFINQVTAAPNLL